MDDRGTFSAEDLALIEQEKGNEEQGGDSGKPAETPPAAEQQDTPDAGKQAADGGQDPAAEPKKPATVLDDADSDEAPPAGEKAEGEAKPKEPAPKAEDRAGWREDFATRLLDRLKDKIPGDKIEARRTAILKQLGRYKTEFDYLVAGFSAQERIRSGEMRSKLPADATDEDKAAWRAENEIPAKAADYDIPKVPGHKWSDADKPIIEDFKAAAHAVDMTQAQVNKAAEWYAATVQKQATDYYEGLQQTDTEDAEQAKAQMRAELGADYKPTLALLRRGLEDRDLLDEASAQALLTGRFVDQDGKNRRIINLPGVRELLIGHFRDTYGEGALIRGDARTAAKNDIEEAERIMNEDLDRYYREGWDEKALKARQEQEKLASRRRAA